MAKLENKHEIAAFDAYAAAALAGLVARGTVAPPVQLVDDALYAANEMVEKGDYILDKPTL